jgi:hypothetical protein
MTDLQIKLILDCEKHMIAPANYVLTTLFTYLTVSDINESINILYAPEKKNGFRGLWIQTHNDACHCFSEPGMLPELTRCVIGGVSLNLPFYCSGDKNILESYDVIAIVFYFLTQWHENKAKRDAAKLRTDFKGSFFDSKLQIEKPIVTLLLQELIDASVYKNILSISNLYNSRFQIALTHDVDFIPLNKLHAIYRAFKNIIIEIIVRKKYLSSLMMFMRLLFRVIAIQPIQDNILSLSKEETALNLKSCFLFVPNGKHGKDPLYDVKSKKVKDTFLRLKRNGFEIGVHYSFLSCSKEGGIQDEYNLLSDLVGPITTSRQHYLNVQLPYLYSDLQKTNINCDMSMAYTPIMGYKTGFDRPHRAWDVINWKPSSVINIPMLYFDTTLSDMSHNAAIEKIEKYLSENKRLGSTVSLLWHDSQFDNLQTSSMRKMYFDLIYRAKKMGCEFKLPNEITEKFIKLEENFINKRLKIIEND